MDRNASFCMFVAAFIVLWSSSFTIKYKVQGFEVPTRHRQCKLRGFDTACLSCDMSCTELRCGRLRPDGYYMETVIKPHGGVVKGTKCDDGKICINRRCVKPRLEFPRYIGDDEYHECKPPQPLIVTYTRSEQCQRPGFAGVCEGHSTDCTVLHCARNHDWSLYSQKIIPRWGVEIGTHCGENKICINRKCVDIVGMMPEALGRDNTYYCTQDRILPGRPVKTRHEQCLALGFDVACTDEHRTPDAQCYHLRCGYKIFPGIYLESYIVSTKGMPPICPVTGTKCGKFHTCQDKKCWATTPAKMPTYTGSDIYHDCYQTDRKDRIINV